MARTRINELRKRRLAGASAAERAEFNKAYAAAALAIRVGEQIRDARRAAELSQRDLALRMRTSQAAIARATSWGSAPSTVNDASTSRYTSRRSRSTRTACSRGPTSRCARLPSVALIPRATVATEPARPIRIPSSDMRFRFGSRRTVPPPVDTTMRAGVGRSAARISV